MAAKKAELLINRRGIEEHRQAAGKIFRNPLFAGMEDIEVIFKTNHRATIKGVWINDTRHNTALFFLG